MTAVVTDPSLTPQRLRNVTRTLGDTNDMAVIKLFHLLELP